MSSPAQRCSQRNIYRKWLLRSDTTTARATSAPCGGAAAAALRKRRAVAERSSARLLRCPVHGACHTCAIRCPPRSPRRRGLHIIAICFGIFQPHTNGRSASIRTTTVGRCRQHTLATKSRQGTNGRHISRACRTSLRWDTYTRNWCKKSTSGASRTGALPGAVLRCPAQRLAAADRDPRRAVAAVVVQQLDPLGAQPPVQTTFTRRSIAQFPCPRAWLLTYHWHDKTKLISRLQSVLAGEARACMVSR